MAHLYATRRWIALFGLILVCVTTVLVMKYRPAPLRVAVVTRPAPLRAGTVCDHRRDAAGAAVAVGVAAPLAHPAWGGALLLPGHLVRRDVTTNNTCATHKPSYGERQRGTPALTEVGVVLERQRHPAESCIVHGKQVLHDHGVGGGVGVGVAGRRRAGRAGGEGGGGASSGGQPGRRRRRGSGATWDLAAGHPQPRVEVGRAHRGEEPPSLARPCMWP
jgi:uncharacterized membrane protein YgcG